MQSKQSLFLTPQTAPGSISSSRMLQLLLILFIFHPVNSFGIPADETSLNAKSHAEITVSVDTNQTAGTVSKRFLSAAFVLGLLQEHWPHFNFSCERPFTLARGLSPAYLRFGGTAADFLLFGKTSQAYLRKNFTEFTITKEDIDKIAFIGRKGNLDVIFDLNVCLREAGDRWNYTNPLEILEYVASQGYHFGWELGNEPNHLGKFNKSITATKLGEAFLTLRKILKENTKYGSLLVGPAVTRPHVKEVKEDWTGHVMYPALEYLESFLSTAKEAVDAVTWHQYYFDSRTCQLEDFYDPEIMDVLIQQLHMINAVLAKVSPDKRPWLGETDSAWGGGAAGMSDTYVAGFVWLDKLGLAARMGTEVVIRQTFFHGHYALVNDNLDPNPDYWLSLLHKRLVGQKVLDVKNSLDAGRVVRVYAHCTNVDLSTKYSSGSVTVMAMNLDRERSAVLTFTGDLSGLPVDEFLLTPADDSLTSPLVKLNGNVLQMIDDTTLPPLKPVRIPTGSDVTLPPLTFGFWVVPDAQAKACLQ